MSSAEIHHSRWAPGVLSVVLAFLVGGVPGLLIVLTVVIDPGTRRTVMPVVSAVALLSIAAVATVVEGSLSTSPVDLEYALQRPVAAAAARFAGVAAIVALIYSFADERARNASVEQSRRGERWRWDAQRPRVTAQVRRRLRPVVLAGALVIGVSVASEPPALSVGAAKVVASLRAGGPYVPAETPPMVPVVALFVPGGERWATVVVRALLVVAVMCLGNRIIGRSGAASAGVAVAGAMVLGGIGLADSLTALFVVTGLRWAWPADLTNRRAVVAGLCLAGAISTRPEAVVVLLATCAWLVGRRGRRRSGPTVVLLLTTTMGLWPWFTWLRAGVGTVPIDVPAALVTSPRWWVPLVVATAAGMVAGRPGVIAPPAPPDPAQELGRLRP